MIIISISTTKRSKIRTSLCQALYKQKAREETYSEEKHTHNGREEVRLYQPVLLEVCGRMRTTWHMTCFPRGDHFHVGEKLAAVCPRFPQLGVHQAEHNRGPVPENPRLHSWGSPALVILPPPYSSRWNKWKCNICNHRQKDTELCLGLGQCNWPQKA